MGSTAKRNAKQSARATAPAAARPRVRTPGRSDAKTAKTTVAPAHATPAKARPRAAPFPLRAVFEQLEPRLLMSADLIPLAADALFAAPAPAGGAEFRSLTDAGQSSAVTASGLAPIQRTHEVVFVDPRVPDRKDLLAGLTAQAAEGRRFEIIVLDPARDGIAQVTAALAERIQVDAVHFITHGTDAAVQLGGTWLDARTLAANADAIASWGNALKEDADLLFYGCDFAASARGRALVDWLAELTRADVAASTDATGAAKAGGDWALEAKVGTIETAVAVGADARERWSHSLGAGAVGLETLANTTTGNTQEAAAVATAPDGRFVVAWVSDGQDGGGKGIFARLYDASGAPQTIELPVNTTTSNDQVQPAVAMYGAGFVVAWSGSGTGDTAGVFARLFNAAGTPLGAEFRVNGAVTSGTQSSPDIAMETNGDFAVVWQSDETGSIEVWLQRYQANGTAVGGASLVSISGGDDSDAAIAMDDDGDFVVAWEAKDDGSNEGIFTRRYDNAGNALGGPTLANATTSGHQQRPDVAMDADGDYVVVWDREGASDSNGVYGRRFSASGTALGSDFRVNTETSGDQEQAAVSMSGDGRFVVTWDSNGQDDGGSQGIYRQEYTAAGAPDGGELLVNTTTNNDQTRSAVAMDDSGSYVVAWSGQGTGDSNGVFWRRFAVAAAGTITGTVYHDIDGDGNLAGATTFAGAVVRLYRDNGTLGFIDPADTLFLSTTTDAAGVYTFSGMPLGTYYVVVDSRTLGAPNVWAEQTYGSVDSALGAGFTGGAGALFGGRSALVSDDAAGIETAEHVTKVAYTGTGVGNVDFGFSFNAVTSRRDGDDVVGNLSYSVQGSLRQFIQNSNATAGVLDVANFSIGSGPQTINVVTGAELPALAITDAVVLDAAATQEGFTGTPLIELNGASAGPVSGLTLSGAGGSTVRGLVINDFTGNGIFLRSNGNVISGNVISGNSGAGIEIEAGRSGNRVTANYIGTNTTGSGPVANTYGVNLLGGANTIGGTAAGEGNVISGNLFAGVVISGTQAVGNLVQGNLIGTNAAGTLPVGNSIGVSISGGATGNQVGGTGLNAGNTIAFNSQDGVQVTGGAATAGNTISGNAFRQNNGLGIDLTNDNVTFNDGALDADTGANGLQNHPQLLAAGISGGNLNVRFGFASTAGRTFRIELFASSAMDPSGFGEGQRYLDSFTVTTDGSGFATSTGASIAAAVAADEFITATATDLSSGNTSEFSNAVVAGDRTISGTIHHDVNGNANVADDGAGAVFANLANAFSLYLDNGNGAIDAGDLFAGTTGTDAAGFYSFVGLGNATYWVVVDSKVVSADPNVWAEQTYGDDSSTAPLDVGVRYGGRNAAISDDATTLATAEHVSRVVVAGANVANVDLGFSFNAIVNVRGDAADDDAANARLQQGTLRQFILNSNALAGAQTANFSIGATGSAQSIAVTGLGLPTITDAVVLDAWTQAAPGYTGPPLIELNGAGSGQDGFLIASTAGGSMVRGFVINRFGGDGLHVEANDTIIVGNYIGTDASGTAAAGNAFWGVHFLSDFNRLGGTGTGEGNVIAGNLADGVFVDGSTGNVILGNYIGLDAAGTTAIGNDGSGIWLSGASGTTIGGTVPEARNVISGNAVDGITGIGSSGNLIQGNYVGTDVTGSLAIGNGEDGVYLQDGSNNTVGGTAAAARNVLSANGWSGLTFYGTGSGNVAQGNYIGTNAAGTGPLGNVEQGVLVATPGPTTIGGIAAGAGNRIAYNGWDGVEISAGTGHAVLGNSIYQNGDLGIDLGAVLGGDGPTPNDAGDSDTGTNNLQNFPALTGAATNGTTVTIAGSLDSVSSASYRVEFFANGATGQRYLGFTTVPIGAAGTATFTAIITAPVALGETVTATATGPDGSTSEFSASVTATAGAAISGTIFHDVNGNANVTDDAGAVFAGVDVRLHLDDGDGIIDSGDSFVNAVTTTASGTYSFGGLAAGTYYVVVNSRTLSPDVNVWGEQTYAVIGAATGGSFTLSTGALYGGRERLGPGTGTSDNAAGAITTAEHLTKVTLAGGNVTNVNSGFSFNAIVNARGDTADEDGAAGGRLHQGSLRQFILNANALSGTQVADFSINFPGGGGPQSIALAAALPTITQAVILDAAATQEGFSGTPIIELNGAGAGGSANGLTITGGGSTVRGFVINRFSQDGISVSGGTGNTIAGNYIGTDIGGAADLGNGRYGIQLASGANVVGGASPADRNVISGNNVDGIRVFASSGNIIRGNYIGTDRTGMLAIGNTEDGIWLDGASNTLIGGAAAGEGNVISGNAWSGIGLSSGGSGNVVYGNRIGVDAAGTSALGNARHGVDVAGSNGTTIGGLGAGQANVIAHNNWDGVAITSGTGHSILGNSIYANSGLGIDLADDGVTANDYGLLGLLLPDLDGGPNGQQNFPDLTAALVNGPTTTISGTLAGAASTFRVEFFASSAADPTGYGEGQRYLGFTNVTGLGLLGSASFTSPPLTGVAPGEFVTATATDASGNTSEFSFRVVATSANPPVNAMPGTQVAAEDTPLPIGLSVADIDGDLLTVQLAVSNGRLDVTLTAGASISVGANGSATLTLAGTQSAINATLASLVYRGNLNYSGADALTVRSTDSGGLQDLDAIAITVAPVNDAPTAVGDAATMAEDSGPNTVNVLANDSIAPDVGETLTITGVTQGAGGSVAIVGAGTSVRYTPNADFFGVDAFTYTIDDGNGGTATATVNVTVVPANDPPQALNDTATVAEDSGANTIDVLLNDSIAPDVGETLTITGVTQGASGSVAIVGGTTVTYTPNAGYSGPDSFTYTIADGNGGTATATVTVTVSAINDPPTANDDAATVAEDSGASTIDVLLNDSILPDAGETLAITGVTQGAGGSVAILGGGTSVSYTPNADFFGVDAFTYTIDDGNGGTATATVNVTVTPANDPPVANDDVATVAEDSGANTINVLGNDSTAPDAGETLTIIGVTQGASGSVAILGGTTVAYTPNAGYSGPDSFTYTIDDGNGGTATATVAVTVTNVNNSAPVNVVPGAQISAEDATLVFSLATGNLIAVSDPDAGANPLEVTLTAVQGTLTLAGTVGLTFTVGDGAADATMTFTGTQAAINAALDGMSFLPPLDYDGPASVTITTGDLGSTGAGGPQSDSDTVGITVVVVDDPPTLDLDANNSSGALGADYAQTFTEGNGSVPIADFDATLADNDSANLASLTVTITNLLDGVDEVLTADTTGTLITANIVPGSGVLTLNGADTVANYQTVLRTIRYENLSDAPSLAQRIVTFVASDGGSASNVGTVRVTIAAVNDAPTATIAAASYAATENVTLTLHGTGLAVADIDALPSSIVDVHLSSISGLLGATQGDSGVTIAGSGSPTLTLTGTIARINALLAGTTSGTVTYSVGSDSPAPTDTLDLAIDDRGATGSGGALWGWDSVTVNLTAVNDAPLITTPGTVSTPEDTPLVFSSGNGNQVSITDVDAAGSPVELTVNVTNGAVTLAGTAGLVFLAGDGTADASMRFQGTVAAINTALDGLVFVPTANYNGSGFLSLAVNDLGNSGLGGPLSDGPELTTITITAVNDLPSGASSAVSMPQDTGRAFGAADFGFSDGDAGDAMSGVRIDTLSLPPGATLQLSGANVTAGQFIATAQLGNLVFAPAPGMSGVNYASFTFSVQDTNGPAFAASANTLTVNVTPVGTPGITATPTAGLVTTESGGTATFSVVLDTQPLADVVITLSSGDATEGTVAPPSLTFTNANWNVSQTVTVTGVADALPDGNMLYTIVLAPATSADPSYDGLDAADVSVTNLEANVPPTANIAQPSYTVTEGSFLPLAGTGLSVADVDAGPSVTVTLSVNAGLLVVSSLLPTVAVAGSGTPVVTLTGLVADIDAILAGAGVVNYFVGSDSPPAFDTLTLAINDNHPFDPRTDSEWVRIDINAVNDAPVNTLPGGSTTLEDTPYVFSSGLGNQISVTDVDAGGTPVQVTLNAANGVITLGGIGGLAFTTGDGTADAAMTFSGTLPAINAALNGLVFTPNLDYNGLAFIQLRSDDQSGGIDSDLATIDVLPVNDAPNGTDTTVTLNEDSTYTFGAGDFGFNDVDFGDAMTEVRIDSISLPAGATLQLGGVNVIPAQVITVADINAGLLVFTPVADANGAGYASFTFSVRDTGVPPGLLFDVAPNTMTVNVAPVNDLPIITSDGGGATAAFVVAENTAAVTTVTATDIDLQPLAFSLAGVDAGRFSIDSVTGVLRFNPAPNFEAPGDAGADNVYNVTVRVSDGAGGVDTQALTVTVTDAKDAPTAGDDAYATDEDLPLSIAAAGVLTNDGDEDGTPITAVLVAGPANGAVAFNADGSFVYTPNANFFGVDTFTYQASDGALGSALATVSITVNPINDAPSAADGNVTILAAYAFAVADFNYFDVDGDPLDRVRITALPVEGQLLFDGLAVALNQEITAGEVAAGRLTYAPPTTSSATAASFGFSVSDGTLYEAASHTMTIGFASGAVTPPAPPPAPPTITPPATPPAGPPAEPPAAGEPGEPGGGAAASGGGRGGGSGGGEGAAPPAPPAPEGAAAPAETAQAAAGVVASAASQVGSAPAGSIGFQSSGVAANPNIAAPALPADQRGEPPTGEVKADMEAVAAMAAPEVRQALDEMRERAQEDVKVEARVAGSVFVVSTGLSVGYVLWLLRGGALIASLLSSLPAWRLVDPLPVLGSMGGRAGDEDDDSLEDLVADNGPPSAPGEDALDDNDNVGSVRT